MYNHETQGDCAVLTGPHSTNQDDLPILREEVEAAVTSLKKRKSAGVDNIPAELVQAGGEAMIDALHIIYSKIWQTGKWQNPVDAVTDHHATKEREPANVPKLSHNQSYQPSQQGHAKDPTQQAPTVSRRDHR